MHHKHCCNPFIYNICFEKCHRWATLNCFRNIARHDQSFEDLIDVKECGTVSAEFAPCIQKEIADQIFYDCCKLYVESKCHELCQYETNRDVAQSLLLETFHKKKCSLDSISSILYCASQNRDNRLCCKQFGLTSPKSGISRRCLQMCDPYRLNILTLRKDYFVCLSNWDIIMYCHHGGLRY
ncbi:DB module family protein [Brugia pahangi]